MVNPTLINSEKLEKLITDKLEADPHSAHWISDLVDMVSTHGHNTDGSTVQEIIELGITLGTMAAQYSTERGASCNIYTCTIALEEDGTDTVFYMYGLDEDDAARRLHNALTTPYQPGDE